MKQERTAKKIRSCQQAVQALQLRCHGLTFEQIGRRLDPPVSKVRAFKIVDKEMKKLIKDAQDEAKSILYLELYRLNQYRFALSPNIGNPRVVDTLLRIIDREARLMGLYPPRRVETCGPNEAPIQAREKAPDLNKLNIEELLRLEALYKKAGVDVYELWGRKLVDAAFNNAANGKLSVDDLLQLDALYKKAERLDERTPAGSLATLAIRTGAN